MDEYVCRIYLLSDHSVKFRNTEQLLRIDVVRFPQLSKIEKEKYLRRLSQDNQTISNRKVVGDDRIAADRERLRKTLAKKK